MCTFCHKKPYCTLGSLRDQLLYPTSSNSINDGEKVSSTHDSEHVNAKRQNLGNPDLLEILHRVDLAELPTQMGNGNAVQGLDAVVD